jgi:hypothetical protein
MAKETSVDVARIAAALLAADEGEIRMRLGADPKALVAAIRSVAASALAQREADEPALGSIEAAKLRQALIGIAFDELIGRDCTAADTAHDVKAAIDRRFGEFLRLWRRE